MEVALLAGSVLILMIVELLNTGIETAIDRIGPEWHDLSKRAKDMGSAAVLLSLLLCIGIWCGGRCGTGLSHDTGLFDLRVLRLAPGNEPGFADQRRAVGDWIGRHGGQLVYTAAATTA